MSCLGETLPMGWSEPDLPATYVEPSDLRSVSERFNSRSLRGYREFGDHIICVLLRSGSNDAGLVMSSRLNGDGCRSGSLRR